MENKEIKNMDFWECFVTILISVLALWGSCSITWIVLTTYFPADKVTEINRMDTPTPNKYSIDICLSGGATGCPPASNSNCLDPITGMASKCIASSTLQLSSKVYVDEITTDTLREKFQRCFDEGGYVFLESNDKFGVTLMELKTMKDLDALECSIIENQSHPL